MESAETLTRVITKENLVGTVDVRLFFRRANPTGNVSIEQSFEEMVAFFPKGNDFRLNIFRSSYYSMGVLPRLKAILEVRRHRSGINHVTGDTNFLALGLPGKNTVLTIHDCGLLEGKGRLGRWVLWLFWLKLPVASCEYITAVSEATKRDIIQLTGCGAEKIMVIPTIIKSFYRYKPHSFRKEYPTILHIGNSPNKNLERHAKALSGLPCHLHIIGKFDSGQTELLKKLKIDATISYNLTNEEMYAAYCEADILLFCSTIEGFGMPIIEAQTVGRVVITSRISSMPEVAGVGGACFVDPYNIDEIRQAVKLVIADDNYRNSLIKNGFENIKRFNSEVVARQYFDLYKKVMDGKV